MANRSRRIIEAFLLHRSPPPPPPPRFNQIPSTSQNGNYLSHNIFSANSSNSYDYYYFTPSIRRTIYSSSTPPTFPPAAASAAGFSNQIYFLASSKIKSRLLLLSNSRVLISTSPSPYYIGIINSNNNNNQSNKINGFLPLGYRRCFSSKTSSDFSKRFVINRNFTKTLVDKPLSAIRSAFVRYRGAVGLQIEAFWRRNYMVLLGVGAFGLCLLLWRIMFGIADTFIGFSEGMAKYGFLALSSAIVAFAGLYVRSRFTINPDKVYRIAMRKLNTSAGILEVMGAPLSGTDLRAYVMSAGGLRLKNFKPKLGGKRCFLIFPIHGSERKGLVSVEVKKKKGQYDMKLLAVDVPMTTGPDQRFFLIGDEEEYKVGGGLISELRDPIVKAMAAAKEFEALDQKEEEEDAERELKEAERKNREEIEKLEKGN